MAGKNPISELRWINFRRLKRFEPELEQEFLLDFCQRSLRAIRWALVIGLILYPMFGFLDPWIVPAVTTEVWFIRFAIVVPVVSGVLVWSFLPSFPRFYQGLLTAAALIAGLGVVAMTILAPPEGSSLYYAGLLLVIPWAHGLVRLRFVNATGASLLISAAYLVSAVLKHQHGFPILLNNVFFLLGANVIGMLVSYNNELSFRRSFKQRKRLEEGRRQLEDSVRSLRQAQDRILELEQSSGSDDLGPWLSGITRELQSAVQAREVRVWALEEGSVTPLTDGEAGPPEVGNLNSWSLQTTDPEGRFVIPVLGVTNSLVGAIVVCTPARWDDDGRRFALAFSKHLGSSLEIRRLRRDLNDAKARRSEVGQQLRKQGVPLLRWCPSCGTCYQSGTTNCEADQSRLIGRDIPLRIEDRYHLIRLLGQGGTGQVFEAMDTRIGRPVAVKLLLTGASPLLRAQLNLEARAFGRVAHRGIVKIYDVGDLEDGSSFLVLELLYGKELGAILSQQGSGQPTQVAELLRQTGSALRAAHTAGFVHRDLKPKNIFLESMTEGGFNSKILDFGIARSLFSGDTTLRTIPGMLVGTPSYMAPEQVRGEAVDARCDVYGLAATIFEALTGQALIPGGQRLEATLFAVLSAPVPRVSSILSGVPPEVDHLILQALSKDPDLRPVNVESWATELADAVASIPPQSKGWFFDSCPTAGQRT